MQLKVRMAPHETSNLLVSTFSVFRNPPYVKKIRGKPPPRLKYTFQAQILLKKYTRTGLKMSEKAAKDIQKAGKETRAGSGMYV